MQHLENRVVSIFQINGIQKIKKKTLHDKTYFL